MEPFWVIILLIFFSGVTVLMLIKSGIDIWMGSRSKAWPHTVGQIVSAEVEKNISTMAGDEQGSSRKIITYTAKVVYKYIVYGRSYLGKEIAFGYEGNGKGEAEKRVAYYHDTNQITVYYNPNDPSQAVLEPGAEYALSCNLVGILFFAVVIIFCWVDTLKK